MLPLQVKQFISKFGSSTDNNYAGKCNFACLIEVELFPGGLINVLFISKEQHNLSLIRLVHGHDANGCWKNSQSSVLRK